MPTDPWAIFCFRRKVGPDLCFTGRGALQCMSDETEFPNDGLFDQMHCGHCRAQLLDSSSSTHGVDSINSADGADRDSMASATSVDQIPEWWR